VDRAKFNLSLVLILVRLLCTAPHPGLVRLDINLIYAACPDSSIVGQLLLDTQK